MPSPLENSYVITLRSKDKIMGANNNFTVALPNFLPNVEYYKIKLIYCSLPHPNYNSANLTHRYQTGGIEIQADFGTRTNSLDTSRNNLQSYGIVKNPIDTNSATENDGDKPEHIVSNPRFQNIRIKLVDSDGNLLVATKISDGTTTPPSDCILQFSFIPL